MKLHPITIISKSSNSSPKLIQFVHLCVAILTKTFSMWSGKGLKSWHRFSGIRAWRSPRRKRNIVPLLKVHFDGCRDNQFVKNGSAYSTTRLWATSSPFWARGSWQDGSGFMSGPVAAKPAIRHVGCRYRHRLLRVSNMAHLPRVQKPKPGRERGTSR